MAGRLTMTMAVTDVIHQVAVADRPAVATADIETVGYVVLGVGRHACHSIAARSSVILALKM